MQRGDGNDRVSEWRTILTYHTSTDDGARGAPRIRSRDDRHGDRLTAAAFPSLCSRAIRRIGRATRAFLFFPEAAIKGDELGVGGEGTQRIAWALSGEWQCDRDGENGKQNEAHGSLPGVISVRDAAARQD